MILDQIAKGVYANTEGKTGGNVGIVVLENRIVAIDSQYTVTGADFRRSIRSVSTKPVTHLLLTHHHRDHVFGNQMFEDCEIVAHRLVKELMEINLQTEWTPSGIENFRQRRPDRDRLLEGLRIVLPTTTFEDRYVVEDQGRVEMIHTGGHTACSTIVYVPDAKTIFAGDLIFAKMFPRSEDPSANPDMWIDAFKLMLQMDVETIVPGHGLICDKTEVQAQLAFFETVKKEMCKLIAEGAPMEDAIAYEGYPEFYHPSSPERRDETFRQWYTVWRRTSY